MKVYCKTKTKKLLKTKTKLKLIKNISETKTKT